MSIEAMKQALGALDAYSNASDSQEDARAHTMLSVAAGMLRAAIIEAEKHEAWEPSDTSYRPGGLPQDFIVHESEKQEPVARNTIEFHSACNTWVMRITADRRIEVNEDVEVTEAAQKVLDAMQHLLTPTAQRQWVGLTDEEISELWAVSRAALPRYATYASLVEAKLQEKNHG